ncbi:hypothetical protein [Gemmata sp.]|uniref:hypothetical protein n=1 Tax=Gemmata sp. TaxID=1914242 RepID=UPI003F6E7721
MPIPLVRPWRSVWLARAVTAVALLAGLPLYLRMPLWCDLTLYDLAARNVLTGGVHYRDVFDTNLPGFVWLLACIRAVIGFGAFGLRCVDLAIVTAVVALIDRLARRGGATPASRWWAVAGAALLYPFAVEMAHCQRDTWMALPVLGAVLLRLKRGGEVAPGERFWRAALEGVLWALAVWIKPHVVLIAGPVWLVTAWRLAGDAPVRWKAVAADLLGNVAGGAVIGAAGVGVLVATGTWGEFWEVVTWWAPQYAELGRSERANRVDQELHWFPPWSLWLVPTLPLALLSVLDAVPWVGLAAPLAARPGPVGRLLPWWLWDRTAGPAERFARGTVAVLWLVWAFQSFYVQRGFMYVHMAETLIMFGLWAMHRWSMPFVVLVWLALTSTLWLAADANPDLHARLMTVARHDGLGTGDDPDKERYLVRHPLANPDRMRCWAACWRPDLTDHERNALWDQIKRIQDHEASPGWVELEEVAAFLRAKGVKDGELLAWHDSPHALYLTMNLKPGIRYMHTNTAVSIGPDAQNRVMWELGQREGAARYAVSDLKWANLGRDPEKDAERLGPPASATDLLPAGLLPWHRRVFPFNQKTVFRSGGGHGRYVVHELSGALGDLPPPQE